MRNKMRRNRLVAFVALWLLGAASASAQPLISTIAGGGPDHLAATASSVSLPITVVSDTAGNYFIASNHRVFKVDTTGLLTVVAGTGTPGYSGDGEAATNANLNGTFGVAVDASGDLFITDYYNLRIRRVDGATGIITTVAGNGTEGFSGDGGAATNATFSGLFGVAVDAPGNLFIADAGNKRIRRVAATTGIVTTVAGNGTAGFSGDGGPATGAALNAPFGMVVDASGNLFIADQGNQRVRRVAAATGIITTVAGNGREDFSGDGGAATNAGLRNPSGLAFDASGNLLIADTFNQRIRRVAAATGIITTVAGNGSEGLSGDGGAATSARLNRPSGVAVGPSGNLFIADYGNFRVRRVAAATAIITTVAGNGTESFSGDGAAATSASLNLPFRVAVDASHNLFIADLFNQRIRRVAATTGIITTVAGNGTEGFSGDGRAATSASLSFPSGVAVDASGNLFIADSGNQRIRRVDASTGIITTVAGNGIAGFGGDGGAATGANLNNPISVTVDPWGDLFIADPGNFRIRWVQATTGIIMTAAGSDQPGFSGDGGAATSAALNGPTEMAVDGSGDLFFADQGNHRIRRVDGTTGIITTVAGNGTAGFSGDGGAAANASLNWPSGVAVDASGNLLFIADSSNQRVRRVDATTGIITTVVGSDFSGFGGDGGLATSAYLSVPVGLAMDASGNLFIADPYNLRIRLVQ
jgi:sugar lactone lactonase YvrE